MPAWHEVPINERVTIKLHPGAKILGLHAFEDGGMALWTLSAPAMATEERTFITTKNTDELNIEAGKRYLHLYSAPSANWLDMLHLFEVKDVP